MSIRSVGVRQDTGAITSFRGLRLLPLLTLSAALVGSGKL